MTSVLRVVGRRLPVAVVVLVVTSALVYAVAPAGSGYPAWAGDLLSGDLGTSLAAGRPVAEVTRTAVAATGLLALAAAVPAVVVALVAGVWSALHRNRVTDALAGTGSLVAGAVPAAVAGVLLVLLGGLVLPRVTVVTMADPGRPVAYLLPVVALVLATGPPAVREVRAAVVAVLDGEPVRQAALTGVPRRAIVTRHVLPNAAGPLVAAVARLITRLAAAVVVVEYVVGRAGVGRELADALAYGDRATLRAVVMAVAVAFVALHLLADVARDLAGGGARRRPARPAVSAGQPGPPGPGTPARPVGEGA